AHGRVQVRAQCCARWIESFGPAEQAEKAVVRYIFREHGRAEQAISEAIDRIAIAFVEREKRGLFALARTREQGFVCRSIRQTASARSRPSWLASVKLLPQGRKKRRSEGQNFSDTSSAVLPLGSQHSRAGCIGCRLKIQPRVRTSILLPAVVGDRIRTVQLSQSGASRSASTPSRRTRRPLNK